MESPIIEPKPKAYKNKIKSPALDLLADMVVHKQTIHVYGITDVQLDQLMAGFTSLHLIFLGICVGVFCAVSIPYFVSALPEKTANVFFFTMLASGGLSIWCGIGAFHHWRSARTVGDKLTQEKKEVTPEIS